MAQVVAFHASTGARFGAAPRPLRAARLRQNAVRARALAPGVGRAGRAALRVEANELNKWASHDAMDDGDFEDDFNKELATVLLRVLTARAVKLLIEQLQELDVIVGTWFMAFCGEHPPTEGNAFVLKLLAEKGTSIVDHTQRPPVTHVVDPQSLAHRVLLIRADFAAAATRRLPGFTEVQNTAVLRQYLQGSTFVSGSGGAGSSGASSYRRSTERKRA